MKPINWIPRIAVMAIAVGLLTAGMARAQKGGKDKGGGGGDVSYKIVKLNSDDGSGQMLGGAARDINSWRFIVGNITKEDEGGPWSEAVCWTVASNSGVIESSMHFLDQGIFTHSIASGCNESGEIVGDAGLISVAVYWSDMDADVEPLPTPSDVSEAFAINESGVICGSSWDLLFQEPKALVWYFSGGQWKYLELPPQGDPGLDDEGNPLPSQSFAWDISDAEPETSLMTVVGRSNGNAVAWTVYFDNSGNLVTGPVAVLDPASEAEAVNNTGMICGWTHLGPSNGGDGAVWLDDGSAALLPRTYRGKPARPSQVWPHDLNDSGLIVGDDSWDAIVWLDKGTAPIRLNDFLPKGKNATFYSLTRANAVNDSGEIVGQGSMGESSPSPPYLAIPD